MKLSWNQSHHTLERWNKNWAKRATVQNGK